MQGGGKLEFYASWTARTRHWCPALLRLSQAVLDDDWYKLFFPAGTLFGLTAAPNAPWMTYDWAYSDDVTCGTASRCGDVERRHQPWR